ncbi:MAG: single-stranded DNA-binding protein [Acidimicrobiia bacterium]
MTRRTVPAAETSTRVAADRGRAEKRSIDGHNKVDLRGQVTGEPRLREFDSGAELFTFNLRVPGRPGRFTSVPVCVWDSEACTVEVTAGEVVRVRGSVVRRFWADPAGVRRSVVEVVADEVAPGARQRRS